MLVGNNIALVVYGYFMGELLMPYFKSIYNKWFFNFISTNIDFYINHFDYC